MKYDLSLHKMNTKLIDGQANYFLGDDIHMNKYLGHRIILKFDSVIFCSHCGNQTKKSYSRGYCFLCARKLPQCDMCILKPELCHYASGSCRDPEWGKDHCLKTHIVYLADTGALKVGITRIVNTPHRWIDQGASQAIPIFLASERLISGLAEINLKKSVSDKTNWRNMLKGLESDIDLLEAKNKLQPEIQETLSSVVVSHSDSHLMLAENAEVIKISYPVIEYPNKIASYNIDKNPEIDDVLMGIKGQYLIFKNGVFNVSKFSGYQCSIDFCDE